MHRVSSSAKQSSQSINLVDCNSLLEVGEAIAAVEQLDRVQVEYSKLSERLKAERVQAQWAQANVSIALVSANEGSEPQQRFSAMLNKSGFETDISFYRNNYVSVPAGRKPTDFYEQTKDRHQRPLVSLASRLAYALGLLARYDEPQVIIVSHVFELYWPMLNFAQRNTRARVGLAYFAEFLDYRWKQAGILEKEFPFKFFNLEEHSAELLGGVDLRGSTSNQAGKAVSGSGLS